MNKLENYKFKSKLWKYKGTGSWYFVSLSKNLSNKIRKKHGLSEEGWGRLKTEALLGKTKWSTAIWFDTKHQCYLLPIKASVRKTEALHVDTIVNVTLYLKSESGRWFQN